MIRKDSDMDNLLYAMEKGGIERQEKIGQSRLVNSEELPKNFLYCTKEQFEKIGVVFGEQSDDLFINTELPEGWKKVPTDHSMWSKLVDDKGRERAMIFYKAAFYDRDAHITMTNKLRLEVAPEDHYKSNINYEDRRDGKWRGEVYDAGKLIWKTNYLFGKNKPNIKDKLREKTIKWLNKNYPNWEDPTAYWED